MKTHDRDREEPDGSDGEGRPIGMPSAPLALMPEIPHAPGFDHTLSLLRDPYRFVSAMCDAMGSDVFQTRLLLTPTICLRGAEAAALFYGSSHLIMRRGAALRRIEKTLVGKGGVQGLDDEAHRHRKALFLLILREERIRVLCDQVDQAWCRFAETLGTHYPVVLYDVARELLMRMVCAWAGVPLAPHEVARRTREVAALFDHAGAIGPRHWWARMARRRCERWIRGLVSEVREGRLHVPPDCALHAIAWHRDLQGRLLPPAIAAVEVLNIIRPTVAVAVYLVQALHALHLHPRCQDRLHAPHGPDDRYLHWFVQEVRRWYPFFPAAIARVREDFTWRDYRFPAERRVLLDLYGTNHDRRRWSDPEEFRPERFDGWSDDGASLVPQGGGDSRSTHRCPGEPLAIALMEVTVHHVARTARYHFPPQDLSLDYRRLPALPRSRLLVVGRPPVV